MSQTMNSALLYALRRIVSFPTTVDIFIQKLKSNSNQSEVKMEIKNEVSFVSNYVDVSPIDFSRNIEVIISQLGSLKTLVDQTTTTYITPMLNSFLKSKSKDLIHHIYSLSTGSSEDYTKYLSLASWWFSLLGGQDPESKKIYPGKLAGMRLAEIPRYGRLSDNEYHQILQNGVDYYGLQLAPNSRLNESDDTFLADDFMNYIESPQLSIEAAATYDALGRALPTRGMLTHGGANTFTREIRISHIGKDFFITVMAMEHVAVGATFFDLPLIVQQPGRIYYSLYAIDGFTEVNAVFDPGLAVERVDNLISERRFLVPGAVPNVAIAFSDGTVVGTEESDVLALIPGDSVHGSHRALEDTRVGVKIITAAIDQGTLVVFRLRLNFLPNEYDSLVRNDGRQLNVDTRIRDLLTLLRMETAQSLLHRVAKITTMFAEYDDYLGEEDTPELQITAVVNKYMIRAIERRDPNLYSENVLVDDKTYYSPYNWLVGQILYQPSHAAGVAPPVIRPLTVPEIQKMYTFMFQNWIKRMQVMDLDTRFLEWYKLR